MKRHAKAPSAIKAASTGTTRARRTMFGLACLCVLGLAAFFGSSAPSVGAAEHFPGQGFLPDNRAWEMVSPPDKHGGNVAAVSARTQAAADGDAVSFTSSVGFADVQGTNTAIEYIAQRDAQPGTNGWGTHAITPPLKPNLGLNLSNYVGDLSADLSHGVFRSARPLTDAPNVDEVPNLFVRNDLRSPGAGHYELLSDAASPLNLGYPPEFLPLFGPGFAGASADFSHVIFESRAGLTPGTASSFEFKLYENAAGAVRLAGRVPQLPEETSCDDAGGASVACVSAPSSQPGIDAGDVGARGADGFYSARMISADGSRIYFTTGGNIYLREDGTKTFLLNASERDPFEPPTGAAQLRDASRDGSRIFFTTPESLVEEDEDGGVPDLYMYEVEKPEGERLTLISEGADEAAYLESVIGASDDGHYVYFVADGQLVAGEPTAVLRGIYLWHDGQFSYIGQFEDNNEFVLNTPRTKWTSFTVTKTSRVSPDGHHLLFMTQTDAGFKGIGGFGGYDHSAECPEVYGQAGSCRELYTYSADSGKLRCASCNPTGAPATGNALDDVKGDPGPIPPSPHQSHALSEDGRYVFFSSAERLVPEDTNGTWDAYVYDTGKEEPRLLSSGEDKEPSYFLDASADGRDVFIATAEQLSRWDTDTSYDLYDARVDGGLPEPLPPPPSCQGDACQPTPLGLNDPTPASSSFKGAGNPNPRKPRPRCAQGKRRVKTRAGKSRCVKRKNSAKQNRTAKHNRRAGR